MSLPIEGSELLLRSFDDQTPDRTIIAGRMVAHGGNAAIFTGWLKARKSGDPETLALKVFRYFTTPDHSELLRRELEFSRSLRHPHILPFVGTCYANYSMILVSHFMTNGNLCAYLRRNPQADIDLLVLQVSRGLSYLHNEAKIVHGDLKGENVLVSDAGAALLADFGLSTTVDKADSDVTTSTAIRNMYTTRFSAPEILTGSTTDATRVRSKTRQSDVYAFGMLTLQAYTRNKPWAGLSDSDVILRVHQGGAPSRPDPPTMSAFLWSLCTICWKSDPGSRPTIQDVVNFLGRHWLLKTSASLPTLKTLKDDLLELTESLEAFPSPGSAEGLVRRIWQHLLLSPARVLHDHDVEILRKLLSTESGVQALKQAPDAEKTIMVAMALYSSDSAPQNVVDIVADAALAVLDLVAAEENDDVYYFTAQLRPIFARARQRDSESAERLEELFAPAEIQRPLKHPAAVVCVAYIPDGDRIVSGCRDGTVRVWDLQKGQVVGAPMTGHTNLVWSVAVSADGTQIVSGSGDKTVRVWNAATGAVVAVLKGHELGVLSVAFSPDGKRVASGSRDDTIRVWDVASAETVVGPIEGHFSWVQSVPYSPDGLRIASGADGVRVWNAETGEKLWQAEMGSNVHSVAFSRDGSRIVAGCRNGSVRVHDAETGEIVLGPLTGHTWRVNSVVFSPDGTKIASGSDDNTVRIWDAKTGDKLDVLRGHRKPVRSVAFSPDGKHVASASWDNTVRIWDATGAWKR